MCITSCRTFPLLDLTGKDDGQVIALQPFTGYDTTGMYLLQTAIGQFYNRKVVVLAPIKLQPSWFVPVTEAYCADSISQFVQTSEGKNGGSDRANQQYHFY